MASRKPVPEPLSLDSNSSAPGEDTQSPAPLSAKSPRSPLSPFRPFTSSSRRQGPGQGDADSQLMHEADPQRQIPVSQAVPAPPSSHPPSTSTAGADVYPPPQPRRPSRAAFFTNYKAAKSASRLTAAESARIAEENMSRDTDRPSGKVSSQDAKQDKPISRRPVAGPSQSDASLASTDNTTNTAATTSGKDKKHKGKPFSLLGRSRSVRDEKDEQSTGDPNQNKSSESERERSNGQRAAPPTQQIDQQQLREVMGSNVRQRSEDRVPTAARDAKETKESAKSQPPASNVRQETASRARSNTPQSGGHTFFGNAKNFASKGAGALSKGLFGKGERRDSTTKKEPTIDDEHYQLKVMNLPLIQQTRITRISKRLEDSRDKTEFWMPAFPWRAIDYLNYKGSDVEGLYRVPGSGPQIKRWQRRFDEELDIDLFEEPDLYDINIIGSMLKAWMRELPDELFPKSSQDKIAKECAGATEVPQLLIDELSNLSPFNYYLLFAITCHLSLLLAHTEKNKMDFRNLCICFQPCMKIDLFCFNFLVNHWRDCWKGCKTENFYTEQEYQLFEPDPPSTAEEHSSVAVDEERNVSSSDSSKPSSVSVDPHGSTATPRKDSKSSSKSAGSKETTKKKLPLSPSTGSTASNNTVSTTLVVQDNTPPRKSADMRPLSPIKPLSPIGL
ncbi:hypothetical protein BP6252_10360 [Coleophoma cylindrospora]|uniref:Rho-GAP domain-containing protein n=1 Tax=Coleophoma cylindrospora TaxID=1849047 RepID=A0A3D8QSB8_9HELO|nr:hypothetical protein BP6252_10360 [Coleophoma cylindrospora]